MFGLALTKLVLERKKKGRAEVNLSTQTKGSTKEYCVLRVYSESTVFLQSKKH